MSVEAAAGGQWPADLVARAARLGRDPATQALAEQIGLSESVEEFEASQAAPRTASGVVGRRAHVRPLSSIEAESVDWLIADRVPLGMFTILAGEPGLGKSTLTTMWSADVSTGRHGEACADVLLVGGEDVASAVVRPRVEAAGGDLDRIHLLDMTDEHGDAVVELPDDLCEIEDEINRVGAKLVVIDPLNAHLSGAIDSHKDASLRRALAPLSAMAARTGTAVVGVAHLNKAQGGSVLNRLGGSVGYGGVARSVLMFLRDPDDPEGDQGPRRLLAHPKCNVGPLMPSLIYEHESHTISAASGSVDTNRLRLIGESTVTAGEVLGSVGDDLRGDAAEGILSALADGRPHDAPEVKREVRESIGCAQKTVERAATELEQAGEIERVSGGFPRRTTWQLASGDPDSGDKPLPIPVATATGVDLKGHQTRTSAGSDNQEENVRTDELQFVDDVVRVFDATEITPVGATGT